MDHPNTLFLLARYGLKMVDNSGVLESHMWLIDQQESSMKYISLHKSKADRAVKGGEIIDIREATDEEVEAHQELMEQLDKGEMNTVKGRKIVVFQLDRRWNALWPQQAKTNPMAYKGVGFIDWNGGSSEDT